MKSLVRVPSILAIMLLELHNIQVPTCFPRSTMYLIKLFQVLLTIPNSYIITFGPTSTKYKMSLMGLFMDAIGACSKLLQKTNGNFWFKDGKLKGGEDIQFWNQKSVKKWRARRGTDISILLGKGEGGKTVKHWRELLCIDTSTSPAPCLEGRWWGSLISLIFFNTESKWSCFMNELRGLNAQDELRVESNKIVVSQPHLKMSCYLPSGLLQWPPNWSLFFHSCLPKVHIHMAARVIFFKKKSDHVSPWWLLFELRIKSKVLTGALRVTKGFSSGGTILVYG